MIHAYRRAFFGDHGKRVPRADCQMSAVLPAVLPAAGLGTSDSQLLEADLPFDQDARFGLN